MDLPEIGGTSEVDQLLSFGWLPHEAFHLGHEDDVDLILLYKLKQSAIVGAFFLRVFGCANVILFENGHHLGSQPTLSGVMRNFRKTFSNLYRGICT